MRRRPAYSPPMNISLSKTQLRFTGPGGSLLVPDDDEICRRLRHAPRGPVRGTRPFQSRSKIWLHPPTLLPNPGRLLRGRRRGSAPANPGAQIRLPPHRRRHQTGRPLPLPGSRLFRCRHRPKNPAAKPHHRHPQRRTHHRRLGDAKKNSTPLIPPTRLSLSKSSAPAKNSVHCPPIPKAWSGRSAKPWRTKFRATKSVFGSCCRSTCAWAPGTCCVAGRACRPNGSSPRLALHLVNEAAMCLCSYRQRRTLSQKGFELANGLPFVPTDLAIHDLLQAHTVQEAQRLQIALGKLRRAGGHFAGALLALDPHRMTSYSQRQMRRHRFKAQEKPAKMAQTFFLLDC